MAQWLQVEFQNSKKQEQKYCKQKKQCIRYSAETVHFANFVCVFFGLVSTGYAHIHMDSFHSTREKVPVTQSC